MSLQIIQRKLVLAAEKGNFEIIEILLSLKEIEVNKKYVSFSFILI